MSTVNILGMNKKATPLESDELCAKSAVDLVSLIKKREISCVDLMESCIHRYEQVNGAINAVIETNFENALSVSKDVDKNFEQRIANERCRPIPSGIKD